MKHLNYVLILLVVSGTYGQIQIPLQSTLVLPTNISLLNLMQYTAFICGKQALCDTSRTRNMCSIPKFTCSSCSCDESCFGYNACCFDAYRHRGVPEGKTYAGCLSHEFKQSQDVDITKYLMIARCPENETNRDDIFCEHPDEDIFDHYLPVQGVTSGQELTFRNRHCARCHGVADANMTSWIKEQRCSGLIDYSRIRSISDYYKFTTESDQCAIFATPYDGAKVVTCDNDLGNTSVISTCPEQFSEQTKRLCESLEHPIKELMLDNSHKWYKNEICLYCNRKLTSRPDHESCTEFPDTIFAAPLSVLFNYSEQSKTTVTEADEVVSCSSDMVYDIYSKTCRPIYCPVGMVVRNHSCYDLVPSAFGVGYRSAYNVIPTKRIKIRVTDSRTKFAEDYERSVNKIIGTVQYAWCSQKVLSSFTREGFYIRINNLTVYTRVVYGEHKPREIVEKTLLDIQKTNYYWYISNDPERMENSTRRPLLLDDASDNPYSHWKYGVENNDTEVIVSIFNTNSYTIKIPKMYLISDKYFRVVNNLLSCPMILLNQSEYVFLQGDAVLVKATKVVYKPSQYRLEDKNVYICTSFKGSHKISQNKTFSNSGVLDSRDIILTLVCISLFLWVWRMH